MKRLRNLRLPLAVSCVMFFFCIFACSVNAVTVTSAGDSGPGSLRQAIIDVEAGGTISFDLDDGAVIPLLSSSGFLDSGVKEFTIQGPGPDSLFISGQDSCPIFKVADGASVDISGVSFIEGNATSGGAIYNPGGNLTLSNCKFAHNKAQSGGAIYNEGDLSLQSCDFTGNQALVYGGGAILNYTDAALTLNYCTLTSNESFVNGGGGAISNYGALALNSCTLTSNYAHDNYQGGAIYSNSATGGTFLTDCTLQRNSAGSGGAIRNRDGLNYNSDTKGISLSLTNCLLADNEAYRDAGGAISSNPIYNKDILSDCVVRDNTALTFGGGIFYGNDILTMKNCTVSGNIAGSSGGGIAVMSMGSFVYFHNSTISGNIVSSDMGYEGGGIYTNSSDGALQFVNCTITDNSASTGAGISGKNISLKNTILAGNKGDDLYKSSESVTTYGYNLIGVVSRDNATSEFTWEETDIISMDIESADIFSGVLANNGGPTVGAPDATEPMLTLALKAGSLAIDQAASTGIDGVTVSEDQRGVSRPQGDDNDIGAYELEETSYSITTSSISGGGSISPESADVPEGMTQVFRITPYDGFVIEELYVDDEKIDCIAQGDSHTFSNVSSEHELEASFMIDPEMMEDADVEDFGVTGTDKGPLLSPIAITKQDLGSISMEKLGLAELGQAIQDENFVTGFSFEMEFDSPDMGTAVTQVDIVMEISRDLLGTETCTAIDGGDDLETAFFEQVSIFKIVSPDVYDLFEVASEDQDPLDLFEMSSDDNAYYVSMMIVIADEVDPEGEASVQALVEGQDSFFFVYDGAKDGYFTDPIVVARKTADEVTETGTSDGGCNAGSIPAAFGLLMVPLFFLLRR